jgi:hypothetical protein
MELAVKTAGCMKRRQGDGAYTMQVASRGLGANLLNYQLHTHEMVEEESSESQA